MSKLGKGFLLILKEIAHPIFPLVWNTFTLQIEAGSAARAAPNPDFSPKN